MTLRAPAPVPASEAEDPRLARDFAERRPDALASAYRSYGRLLYSVARSILGDDSDAEDCVHDALLRVWERGFSYRAERGTLRAYLTVSVRNEAISRRRNDARHFRIEQSAFREAPEAYDIELVDHVQRGSLQRAVAALPEEQRRVLELSYGGGLSHTEIAARLDVPLGTIKGRLSLALRKLKAALPPG